MTNRTTRQGQPAQPVLEGSSVRELTSQSMPHAPASRAFSGSMNLVAQTLVPKPKFVPQSGCQGTHEAKHLLFHCPFYSSTGKRPLGASHTFGSNQQGQCQGKADPRDLLRDWCANQTNLSSLRWIHQTPCHLPSVRCSRETHRSNS